MVGELVAMREPLLPHEDRAKLALVRSPFVVVKNILPFWPRFTSRLYVCPGHTLVTAVPALFLTVNTMVDVLPVGPVCPPYVVFGWSQGWSHVGFGKPVVGCGFRWLPTQYEGVPDASCLSSCGGGGGGSVSSTLVVCMCS